MPIHIKTMFLCVSVAVALGIAASKSAAQSTGPAAFAAKQDIKAKVLSAMADGKITQAERRDILSHAKGILSANEYVGLVETINRLSPTERAVPEDLGYTPVVDKQLMAKFPAPNLPLIAESKLPSAIAKQSFLKNIIPKQTSVATEKSPKQTYIVKEIITKQTIVSTTPPNQSVVKETKPKQSVVKATTPKQTVAKTTKPTVTSKVVIIPPPPPQKNNDQPNISTVSKVQNKIPKSDDPTPPLPQAGQSQTRNAAADKPVQQKTAESPKKRILAGDQVTILQPLEFLNEAEKSAITRSRSYADYSVPVLTTPAAAFLSDRNTIKASFDQPLEPEFGQSIIR